MLISPTYRAAVRWPFWAPTPHERIEQALDLARLRRGERFVDLGCGDGRVLLAAAERGATVTGIELDSDLAAQARRLLEHAGAAGAVIEADFGACALEADVVFAFLSPATLQRLAATLATLDPGTRVVTIGYGLVGWQPEQTAERCFLYRMPPRSVPVGPLGWASAGVVAGLRSGRTTLTAAKVHHPGGPVSVRADEALGPFVTLHAGADVLDAPGTVVVDLRWDAREPGTIAAGVIECPGVGALAVFGIYTEGEVGVWGLSDQAACDGVAAALADPGRTPESLLERARRSQG